MAFDWLKKKPIDRVEGGEINIQPENTSVAEKAIEQSEEDRKEQEKKERKRRFIARISALMERVELLERKVDRLEGRLGIKNEEK
jgi:hypothetical protein